MRWRVVIEGEFTVAVMGGMRARRTRRSTDRDSRSILAHQHIGLRPNHYHPQAQKTRGCLDLPFDLASNCLIHYRRIASQLFYVVENPAPAEQAEAVTRCALCVVSRMDRRVRYYPAPVLCPWGSKAWSPDFGFDNGCPKQLNKTGSDFTAAQHHDESLRKGGSIARPYWLENSACRLPWRMTHEASWCLAAYSTEIYGDHKNFITFRYLHDSNK